MRLLLIALIVCAVRAAEFRVDETDPGIVYSPASAWGPYVPAVDANYSPPFFQPYGGTLKHTNQPGAQLSFTFFGSAISLLTTYCGDAAAVVVTVDGERSEAGSEGAS